ncbi:hypothetical protein HYH03_007136 [Edaphochlamys debaryana]|uniref:Uncharacterized protein n=1 Tax=Edaphochlamys debaryana TaxID=47281 RepID=A0A835Y3P4_9CHLO|nr:hypothetical protein HYH03_007136 [Edaphochlamys debaryana]|eukprot:KAG2494617.1 hypothetical protein HYH03_007136 [Edaphochlamys debaryana]
MVSAPRPSPSPSATPSPRAPLAPRPAAPPGLTVVVEDYSAKFVNATITTAIDTDADALAAFIAWFKTTTARVLGVAPDDVIIRAVYKNDDRVARRRRMQEDLSLRVWTKPQLPAYSFLTRLTLTRAYAAAPPSLALLRDSEALLAPTAASTSPRRSALETPSSPAPTPRDVVIVDFSLVRLDSALPPTPPGASAPPSPLRTELLDRLSEGLGAKKVVVTWPPPPPPAPPAPPSENVTSMRVTGMQGHGTIPLGAPTGKAVVWFTDPAFRQLRRPRSPLNLVHWSQRKACTVTKGVCDGCPRAWAALAGTPTQVPIYFKEPMQLDSISVTQINAPGLLRVDLLPWPAVHIPGLNLTASNATLGEPVWNVSRDVSACGDTTVIPIPAERSGTAEPVPRRGTQEALPPRLRKTAVGGVLITVRAQEKGKAPTTLESVTFTGRVLYPKKPRVYFGL